MENNTTLPDICKKSVELDGIDMNDYPDFCDAFVTYAESVDGVPLTEKELEELNQDSELVQELVYAHLH